MEAADAARHARVEERLVLTRVVVAPHALLDVIATRQIQATCRSGGYRYGI